MSDHKLDYRVDCRIKGKVIEISKNFIVDDVMHRLQMISVDTNEKAVREALLALGWAPPEDKK